jgi:hypothetical protein
MKALKSTGPTPALRDLPTLKIGDADTRDLHAQRLTVVDAAPPVISGS